MCLRKFKAITADDETSRFCVGEKEILYEPVNGKWEVITRKKLMV